MTSNPTTYKRQVTFNRGLINFPDFKKFLCKAPPLHFFNFPDAEDGDDKSLHGGERNSWGCDRAGGLIRFSPFALLRTVSMVPPSQYKCHDVVVSCVLADICMCISPSLMHFTF